jgi:hypothetical protein
VYLQDPPAVPVQALLPVLPARNGVVQRLRERDYVRPGDLMFESVEYVIQVHSPSSEDGYSWIGIQSQITHEDDAWATLFNLKEVHPDSEFRIMRVVQEVIGGT